MKSFKALRYIIYCIISFTGVNIIYSYADLSNVVSSNINLYLNNEKTDSLFSSDGPIVLYKNDSINSYGITPDNNSFIVYKNVLSKKDNLFCYVDETKQSFSFRLKDSIITEKSVYDLPDKIFIISDIEGNFKGLQSILIGAGVINKDLKWTYGEGHLVFAGDMFDRNVNVTECLWLLYKLEDEAIRQNGKVHFIMGNHEVMNLRKDYRYVRQKYFINSDSLKLDYEKWYDNNSELGRWLRSKNCVEKIGSFLFVHGGISQEFPVADLTLDDINTNFRKRIDLDMTKEDARKDIYIGRESAVWFRGIAEEKISKDELKFILDKTGTSKIIIGHTIFDDIIYLYDGTVIAIDLEHRKNTENGFMKGLLFENNKFFMIDDSGTKINLK